MTFVRFSIRERERERETLLLCSLPFHSFSNNLDKNVPFDAQLVLPDVLTRGKEGKHLKLAKKTFRHFWTEEENNLNCEREEKIHQRRKMERRREPTQKKEKEREKEKERRGDGKNRIDSMTVKHVVASIGKEADHTYTI